MKTSKKMNPPGACNPPRHPSNTGIICAMAGLLVCGLFAAYMICHVFVNLLEVSACRNDESRTSRKADNCMTCEDCETESRGAKLF